MSSLPPDVIAQITSTAGACLAGLVLSSILYGVTLLQTYLYYASYWKKDGLYTKLMVGILWALDTLQLITVAHAVWFYLIQNFGNASALENLVWSFGLEVGVTALIACISQIFFAFRVWRLSDKNLTLSSFLVLISLLSFGFAIFYTAKIQILQRTAEIPHYTWATTTALALNISADFLITGALCLMLRRGRTGIRRTEALITTLILYTVNTGMVTSFCALLTIILSIKLPHTYYDTLFYFSMSKCYVNSILATLNSREHFRETMNPTTLHLSVLDRPTHDVSSGDIRFTKNPNATNLSRSVVDSKA